MAKLVVHLNKWLNRLYKSLAILLVLFAVLLSSLRILLPYAHTYKQDVEDYLNSGYQGQIQIGELTAGWHNLGPTLVVNDLVLTNSSAISIVIDEMDIGLDFWGSIQERAIKATNFTLIGAEIVIDQTKLFVDPPEQEDEQQQVATDLNAISDLMLKQIKRFSLRDSHLLLKTPYKEHQFTIEKLAWLNEQDQHKGIGKVQAADFPENTAKLVVDLTGDSFTDLYGQIYMEGNGLNLAPLFDKVLGEKGDQIDSNIHFKSWMNFKDGRSTDMQVVFEESQFNWNSFEQQHTLVIPQSQISFSRDGTKEHFYVQSSPINFEFNGEHWGDLTLQAEFDYTRWQANIDKVSLTKLWQLYPLFLENFPDLADYQNLNLQGEVENIRLQGNAEGLQGSLQFVEVGTDFAAGIPGIGNLNGDVFFDNQFAFINLHASNSAIDFNEGFERPIPYEYLSGQVKIEWQALQWRLAVENLRLTSTDLSLKADVQYLQKQDSVGELSIFAFLNNVDASKTRYYLPLSIMDESLVEYLNEAIYSGTVNQAAVIVNGPVDSFPYTDKSGVFVVDADLQDAKYRFEESWPAINGLEANLNFTANSMLITATGGDLAGIELTNVAVGIDDFDTSILTVDTPISGSFSAVETLMNNSPLAETVGETISFINPQGQVSGLFSLNLPLDDTDLAVAKGDFTLEGATINLSAPEMIFTDVSGRLSFNNERITTEDLAVLWRGMPLGFDVVADQKTTHYQVDIGIKGDWPKEAYQAQIPESLLKYVDGEVNWQGDLSLFIPEDGQLTYSVDIQSDLAQSQLLLPSPYTKPQGQSLSVVARAQGNGDTSNITANIGDNLSFYGDLKHESPTFARAHLVLGNEKMLLPMDGFHITTALDDIDFSQWYPLIDDILESLPESAETVAEAVAEPPLFSIPERIRGNVANVKFYGQDLSDVSFNLLHQTDSWLLQFNSEQLRSRFRFYHEFEEKGLAIEADFAHFEQAFSFLEETETVEKEQTEQANTANNIKTANDLSRDSRLLLADIPNLLFQCDRCQYKQLNLGEVSFALQHEGNESLILKDFIAQRNGTKLTLNGDWQQSSDTNATRLVGKLNVKDIEQEIEAFGFESTIKDSGAKSSLELSWQGGPDNFNFDTLNGKVKIDLDDGYLADVSDKGARIFSLFSLQSLVRKLTLDFRDVFSKGMFYNSIKANFHFVDGVVYTDNMRMDATAGNLSVKGNTNLVSKRLDYKMSFSPKVTSSLPVIIGWLVNPIMGVAILAADEAIQKAEVISFINFELTGTIDKPEFKEVNRKSRDITVGKSKPDTKQQPETQKQLETQKQQKSEPKSEQLSEQEIKQKAMAAPASKGNLVLPSKLAKSLQKDALAEHRLTIPNALFEPLVKPKKTEPFYG